MLALENAEEVLQILERFTQQKSKDIPRELEEYLRYVAKTGDTVYRWPDIQYLFREKLISVMKDFHDTTPSIEGMTQAIIRIVADAIYVVTLYGEMLVAAMTLV